MHEDWIASNELLLEEFWGLIISRQPIYWTESSLANTGRSEDSLLVVQNVNMHPQSSFEIASDQLPTVQKDFGQ